MLRPPGGSPAALSSLPGLNADLPAGVANPAGVAMDLPGQAATFGTDPLVNPLEVTGAPQVRLRVAAVPTAQGRALRGGAVRQAL